MSKIEEFRIAIEGEDVVEAERLIADDPGLVDCREKTPPPLHLLVWVNKPMMIKLLLDHGADIESRDQDRNTTPVRYAIVYCRKEIIRLLVSRGADLGVQEGGDTTALQMAMNGAAGGFEEYDELPSREEYGEIVELLKELGAE
ncbi:MAG: ankyrin repeat domain-containing protein [Aeoliella sp.]